MDLCHKHISFEPGDFILLLTKHLPLKLPGFHKLKPLWVSPYLIVYACGNYANKLEILAILAKLYPVFNVTLLKRFVGDVVPTPGPIELDNSPEYKVYAILQH